MAVMLIYVICESREIWQGSAGRIYKWYIIGSHTCMTKCDSLMVTSWYGHAFHITGLLWGESEGNPVTGGFPSHRANNGDFFYFFVGVIFAKAVDKIIQVVILDVITSMWRHCNGFAQLQFAQWNKLLCFCFVVVISSTIGFLYD